MNADGIESFQSFPVYTRRDGVQRIRPMGRKKKVLFLAYVNAKRLYQFIEISDPDQAMNASLLNMYVQNVIYYYCTITTSYSHYSAFRCTTVPLSVRERETRQLGQRDYLCTHMCKHGLSLARPAPFFFNERDPEILIKKEESHREYCRQLRRDDNLAVVCNNDIKIVSCFLDIARERG